MSFTKPLTNEIEGSEYNNKLGRMNFTKSDKEKPDEFYAELGDKSYYFNPESGEVFSYDDNLSMYEDLVEDLRPVQVERIEGVRETRKKVTVSTFEGTEKYFNPLKSLDKLQKVVDELKNDPKLSKENASFIRSFSGAKPFINPLNNKRSFVIYAPDFIQSKIDSLDPQVQKQGREEFLLLKERIFAFNRDPNKKISLQKGEFAGANECEMSTVHKQSNTRDHIHMKVGGYLTDENGVLNTVKIKWSNYDDATGYSKALENFIQNDPILVENFGNALQSYTVFAYQEAQTSNLSISSPTGTTPTLSQPSQATEPTESGETDDFTEDDKPFDDDPSIFQNQQNKIIQNIISADTESQAKTSLENSGFILKEPSNYEGEELEADTRSLLDSINKQINAVNKMYSDVVKEKILPLMHANNALVTSQELVLTNKKLVVANKNNATKIMNLEEENETLSNNLVKSNETIADQDKDLKDYITKNSTLSETVISLNGSLESKEKENEALSAENEKLESSLTHAQKRYKQAMEIAAKRKVIIDDLNTNVESLTSKVSEQDTEIKKLKTNITSLEESHKKAIKEIDIANELEKNKLISAHKSALESKEEKITSLNESINSLNSNIKLKDSTIISQNGLISNNEKLIESQDKTISAKDVEIAKLQKDIAEALGFKEKAEKIPSLEKELKETKEVKDESAKLIKEFLKIAGNYIPKEVFEEVVKKSGTDIINSESIDKIYNKNKNTPKSNG